MRKSNYPADYKLSDVSKKGIINLLMRQPHRYIGKKYKNFNGDVLEFGCGDGNNINYFNSYNSYTLSDYKFDSLDKKNLTKTNVKKMKFNLITDSYDSIKDNYDLFLLFHTLEHVQNPETCLENLYYALKPGGTMELIQPNDPSFIWNLGEVFGSTKAPVDKKTYYYQNAREHINSIKNLERLIKYYFDSYEVKYLPLRFNLLNLNLFKIYSIKKLF